MQTKQLATILLTLLCTSTSIQLVRAQGGTLSQDEVASVRERAIAGDTRSQAILGRHLYLQIGGDRYGIYAGESEKWFRLAANKGDAEAQYYLGDLLYRKYRSSVNGNIYPSIEWLEKSAAQGYTAAQAFLIGIYGGSDDPSIHNATKAVYFAREVANKGGDGGQWALAQMYENGEGVPKNYNRAAYWYLRAAVQGHSMAQHDVARMYSGGIGVPQDKVAAYFWWLIVTAKYPKMTKAVDARDRIERELTPIQVAATQDRAASWVAIQEPQR